MATMVSPSSIPLNGVGKGIVKAERNKALVICWKKTTQDSFFIHYDLEERKMLARMQSNNSKIPRGEQFPIIELAKWYWIEYSRYAASDIHVIIHSFYEADEEKELIETRVNGKNVEFKLFFRKRKSADNYFLSCSEEIEIIGVEDQERLGFIAWCTLKAESGVGFRFVLQEMNCNKMITENEDK